MKQDQELAELVITIGLMAEILQTQNARIVMLEAVVAHIMHRTMMPSALPKPLRDYMELILQRKDPH